MFLDLTSEQERIVGIAQELAKEFAPRAEAARPRRQLPL